MPHATSGKHAVGPQCDACLTVSVPGAPVAMSTVTYEGMDVVLCNHPVECRLRAQRKGVWKVCQGQ